MSITHFKTALCATAALAVTLGANAAQAQDAQGAVEEVIVTGTRDSNRTPFTTLAPVDVLNAQTLQASATAQLGENLAQQIPSFIVQKLPTSDGLQFIRPATLRNLSPDQTLVLVNGKRFHRSAFLGSRGAQGPDLAQIVTTAVGRMEVLRDGASAQYGSDAIAGVINILLDEKPGFTAFAQSGQFFEGDGQTNRVGGRAGFVFPEGGHASVTFEMADQGLTSRSRQRQDAIDFAKAHPGIAIDNPVQRWGNPDLTTYQLAANAALPVGPAELYAFGTYTSTEGMNDINWRNPDQNPAIYRTVAVFPGFDLRNIYPGGFTPHEGIKARDFQTVGGLRLKDSDVFTWDASLSYGQNSSRFVLNNSINASMGPDSPRNFYLGQLKQSEVNANLDAVWRVPVGLAEPLNVAFGAESRKETYTISEGDPASYAVGPGAAAGLAPNSNGFPGFGPSQAGEWDQTSYAGYLDVEAQFSEQFSAGAALRYEDFSEFGDTVNGKVAARYQFSEGVAVRASYSTGFRAPTPGQLNSTSTSQGLDTVTLQLFTSGRLSPVIPVAAFLGAKPLQPEESDTLTAGLVWRTDVGLSGSLDAYRINVDKRFSTSPTVTVTPAIRAQLIAQGVPGAESFTSINWFTNDFDTQTSGIDAVVNYNRDLGPGRIALMAAYNYNKTEVRSGNLSGNPTQKLLFETSRPKQNLTASATYTIGPIELMSRARYYGEWTDSTGNATGEIFQAFGAITLVDVAATWTINPNVSLRVGAENVFDTYPDEAVFQASRGLVYSRNAPYDTNGGQYYARLNLRF
ncbi:MAG: TonB-dependent receptor [Caulobacterales bacterium]|nr:TonB-dependent receptor [Caulobacterales bacterium]